MFQPQIIKGLLESFQKIFLISLGSDFGLNYDRLARELGQYLAKLAETEAIYRKGLTESGIDYQRIDTREPYDRAISAYLARRTRVRR